MANALTSSYAEALRVKMQAGLSLADEVIEQNVILCGARSLLALFGPTGIRVGNRLQRGRRREQHRCLRCERRDVLGSNGPRSKRTVGRILPEDSIPASQFRH
jgi:hypothetical protein